MSDFYGVMFVLKVLTVYFTRSGNTEKVVKKIHESIGGDVELISEPVSRKGIVGWLRSGSGNSKREVAEINETQYDPANYDLVILASPIWAGSVSSPMRGYMTENREKLGKTAVFLSNDSGSVDDAFTEIHELLVNPPLVERSLQRSKIKTEFESTVKAFIEGVSKL
jgi:flavodoxin